MKLAWILAVPVAIGVCAYFVFTGSGQTVEVVSPIPSFDSGAVLPEEQGSLVSGDFELSARLEAASTRDSHPEHGQDLNQEGALLPKSEPALGADLGAAIATRAKLASQLRAVCKGAFDARWASGQYDSADTLDWGTLRDVDGHPMPNQVRFGPDGGAIYVTLTREEAPVAYELIGTISQLDDEIQALTAGLGE